VRRFGLDLEVSAREDGGQAVALCLDFEFSPYARALPALQPLPAIFDRVLAEHGSYQLEPLVHGQRHVVRFRAGPRLA
jgi:two-component system sensor histidine kinase UhpB